MLVVAPAAQADEPLLTGPVGVTVEEGAQGPVARFVGRSYRPVALWDAGSTASRLYVLEEISNQLHRFEGELPHGSLTLALYPLDAMPMDTMTMAPPLWQGTWAAQEGRLSDLGLGDPLYELVFGGRLGQPGSGAILSLRSGAELVAMTEPVAVLTQAGQPPLQLVAGLQWSGTPRDVELFGYQATDDLLLSLGDPLRPLSRLRLRFDDPALAAAGRSVAFGFAAWAGEPPSLELTLPAEAAPRLVAELAPGVGLVIPVGPEGFDLHQAVTRGLTLEVVGP